jgi:molybdopterin-guanine dinucleotide biosynthesis protein A
MGKPKACLPFGDELMLPRVVRLLGDALGEAAGPIVVVAAPEQDVPPLPAAVAIVRDEERGRGPLEGLAAGLTALQGRADAAYLSSCDVPFLRPAFVRRLAELLGERQICVPHVGDFHHPLAAVYRLDVLPVVRRLLRANRLRPVYLFDEVRTRIVHADELLAVDPSLQSLRNLNTPEEYAAALAELAAPA